MRDIDRETFQQIAQASLPTAMLSPEEANAIAKVAMLAADIDFDSDKDERELLKVLQSHLNALASGDLGPIDRVSPVPDGAEGRVMAIRELKKELQTQASRELAYVVAYLLVISDLNVRKVEGAFLDELRTVLAIDDDRAAELAGRAAELATLGAGANDRSRSISV